MFAGHVGAGLLLGRGARGVNVGVFIVAALLLDLLLWIFVLAGWESVSIPAEFARTHQATFEFPWSHGLLAVAGWSVAAGALAYWLLRRRLASALPAAMLVAAAVMSHWLLDALVHVAELPLAGSGSARVGLGLWRHMSAALGIEAAIVVAGLRLYLPGSGLPRNRALLLAALCLLLLGFTIAGMTLARPPPSASSMAAGSLLTLVVTCVLGFWLGREPRATIKP
jgi:hypothetical protein